MENLPKIMIAHASWRPLFTKSFYQGMVSTIVSYGGPFEIRFGEALAVAWARNKLAKDFLASDCEYLFFVDTDTGVPWGGLKQLVKHDVDIVSGLYFSRTVPFSPIMKRCINPDDRSLGYTTVEDYPEGLIEVDICGAGCLLIKKKVFETVAEPWFFSPRVDYSEDVFFLEEAHKAGFKVYVDTTVKCLHDTDMTITEALYKGNKQ